VKGDVPAGAGLISHFEASSYLTAIAVQFLFHKIPVWGRGQGYVSLVDDDGCLLGEMGEEGSGCYLEGGAEDEEEVALHD
jgi:hypothetical protein